VLCRKNLAEVIEGWILVRLSRGMEIPPHVMSEIELPQEGNGSPPLLFPVLITEQ